MQKTLLTIALALSVLHGQAQLSLHLGTYTGSPMGLNRPPYDFATFDVPLFGGGEIGYRFVDRFAVYAFLYSGSSSKEYLFDNTNANSTFLEWGIRPQVNVASSSTGPFNFDIGVPLSFVHQEIDWYDDGNWFIFSGSPSGGHDEADFFRVGLAPAFRFYFEEPRLTLQTGLNINCDLLLEADREITEPPNAPEQDIDDGEVLHRVLNIGLHVTFGYSFW